MVGKISSTNKISNNKGSSIWSFFVVMFQDLWKLMIHPGEFFEEIKDEPGIKKPFLYLLTAIIIMIVITSFVGFLDLLTDFSSSSFSNYILEVSFGLAFLALLLLVLYPAWVGVLYFLVLLLRPHHDVYYIDTYKACAYVTVLGTFLGIILELIPFINKIKLFSVALSIYMLVLTIMALARVHEIPGWKATLVELLPIIIITFLVLDSRYMLSRVAYTLGGI